MNPRNDQNNGQVGASAADQQNRHVTPPARHESQQQAAANIIRGQLDQIYRGGSGEDTPHTTPMAITPVIPQASAPADTTTPAAARSQGHGFRTAPPDELSQQAMADNTPPSAYQRTLTEDAPLPQTDANQWQQYHSAWQKYYQLYYERHYLNTLHAQKSAQLTAELAAVETPALVTPPDDDTSMSQREAMKDLRASIRNKVTASAQKVKKSRHFTPALAGFAVLILFMFLQYNRIFFGAIAAYASPGSIEPQNIIASPNTDLAVSPEPRMIIPKINIDAPVVYGVGPDYNSQMTAMEKGIAHFSIPGANAVPGQVGNAVFAAHSSNDVFARGDYKQVFAQNEKLQVGDIIYMNYESKRYTYAVTSTEVVMPSEVSKVQVQTDKPMLTLVSCVPLGTAQKRLLVFAEQISPDPAKAAASTTSTAAPTSSAIPGRPSPTLIERLFGAN